MRGIVRLWLVHLVLSHYLLQGCAFLSIFQDDPDHTCMHGSSRRSQDQPIDLLNGKVNPLSQHAADVLLTETPI